MENNDNQIEADDIPALHGIIGHNVQRQRLEFLWRKNRVPSALMFTGAPGIGKALVAKELFQSMLCEDGSIYGGCKKCQSCRLFQAGSHPDFYERDFLNKDDANVDSLRELLYSLHLNSFNGKARAILLHNTELMSQQGANLLLKILEEPRPNTYFCLLTSNPSRILATILSRCHKWFFDKLSPDEMRSIINLKHFSYDIPSEDMVLLADGTLENIAAIEGKFDEWQILCRTLDRIADGDAVLASSFASELNKDREELRYKLRMLSIYARSRMLKADNNISSKAWSICLTNLLDAEALIFERNIGANYILSLLFLDLAEQAVPKLASNSTQGRLLHEIVI